MPTELSEEIEAQVLRIRSDNTSGAAALTRRAAEVLILLAEDGRFSSSTEFSDALIAVARALVRAQPTMAPIFNLANSILMEAEALQNLEQMQDCVRSTAEGFVDKLEGAGQSISRFTADLIQDGTTIMTHSYSDTVLNALLFAAMASRRFEVICTESRPMGEGITLARKLAGQGVAAKLIVDAAILSHLPDVHMVLVGADAISLDGLTNKTGTSLLALAARKFEKDMYALCGAQKFVPVGYRLPQEPPKDPQEILSDAIANVNVSNYYFDLTPLTWLTGTVTEEGTFTPVELRRRLARMNVHTALR